MKKIKNEKRIEVLTKKEINGTPFELVRISNETGAEDVICIDYEDVKRWINLIDERRKNDACDTETKLLIKKCNPEDSEKFLTSGI
jgi:hypothetical protein